jgi:hypothetical protein
MLKALATLIALAAAVAPAATAHDTGASASGSLDLTRLHLGDGRVTMSAPRRGYVYACAPGQNGAFVPTGPWISGSLWDFTRKPTVDGSVDWPAARYRVTRTGSRRKLSGNGLPENRTGVFPIANTDDAYQYDFNPNRITAQTLSYRIPASPRRVARSACLPGGAIGVLDTGVALFNALDAANSDAPAHEIQDRCGGHPGPGGSYHFHSLPRCLAAGSSRRHSKRIGWALDGFPIYGPRGAGGRYLRNSKLDACHGHTHKVRIDGKLVRLYHYHATMEYPYTLGCFRGTPVNGNRPTGGPPPQPGGAGARAGAAATSPG